MDEEPTERRNQLNQGLFIANRKTTNSYSAVGIRRVWAIGIYTGDSPLNLTADPPISNPVITRQDVSDVQADFVADPFMVEEKGYWYMFFEVKNKVAEKGEIGLAISHNGLQWNYSQIVLSEHFHLSYPYVFKWGEDYYMVPETLGMGCVQLYKAINFPTRWELAGKLIEGSHADPSIFYFENRWWMFVCPAPRTHDTLSLYFADHLLGSWSAHPNNPLIRENRHMARPAGRVTQWGNKLIRFAQDCYPYYGAQVRAFEIKELTPETYSEEETKTSPVLYPAANGWNHFGMHQVDPHQTSEGEWIACVDGCSNLNDRSPEV